VPAIASLAGLSSDRAWRWRDRMLGRAPKTVLSTIAGLDDGRAWAMRVAMASNCREALDSLIGLDHPTAWQLREATSSCGRRARSRAWGAGERGAREGPPAARADDVPQEHLVAEAGGGRRHRQQPQPDDHGGLSDASYRRGPRHREHGPGALRADPVSHGHGGLLGAFLGYRLWRRLLPSTLPPSRETAQAQTLIAIAGALMVVVIGNNAARAFGLVGLGGFIRFRSGIKDTRDAAVMFVMIGIGMACGVGAVPLAMVATLFASVVLTIFDAAAGPACA
jgi:hypothetical protein